MDNRGHVSVFISYAHADRSWMERFRKELKAALFETAEVWCDEDIGQGAPWFERLATELRGASVALVLASSDYLLSPWCRRELKLIRQKVVDRQITNAFWIQLSPCLWERTELAEFQSQTSARGQAFCELQGPVLDREILAVVRDVAAAIDVLTPSLDPSLTFVRTVAGEQALQKNLTIESVITNEGDFSIVCRGRSGDQSDVAIKVMKRSPIRGISDRLADAARCRKELKDPGFIPLLDSFIARTEYEEHLVLVSEYCGSIALRDRLPERPFTVDDTVLLIRRTAEALDSLHELQLPDGGKTGVDVTSYGLMTPKQVFYDHRLHRLRLSSLSISNFICDVLGWKKFAAWVDEGSARYVAPEQVYETRTEPFDKRKVDQYMLGQLAIEMLDGRLWFDADGPDGMPGGKKGFFDNPLEKAGVWQEYHQQLAAVIRRMLHRNPADRWESMTEVARQLRSIEDETRALARYSFRKWLDNDEFFLAFYESFFAGAVDAKGKFKSLDSQHVKLRKAMTSVLNFYPGNEPTSMAELTGVHQASQVTAAEIAQFERSFLEVLDKRLTDPNVAGQMGSDVIEKIRTGWRDLLHAVVQYLMGLQRSRGAVAAVDRPATLL